MQNQNNRPPQGGYRSQGQPLAGNSRQGRPGAGYGQPRQAPRNPGYGNGYAGGYGPQQTRRRPMPEREYRAWQERQRATEAERRHRAEVEKLMRKQENRRRRQRNRQVFLGRLAVFGVVLVIMGLIALGIFLLIFHSAPDAVEERQLTYTYGGAQVRQAEFDDAYSGGHYYFCFGDLADYLGMAETGSAAERRFLFLPDPTVSGVEDAADVEDSRGDGTEEWVRFPAGEAAAIVNGQRVSLDGPNRLIDGEIWVTVDFVEDVMQNLSLQIDGDTIALAKLVDTSVETTENDKNAVILYLDPSFRQKPTEPITPIPEEAVTLPPGLMEEDGEIDLELANVTFVNDLTAYEQYMAPENRDGYLTLVNPTNTLSADYSPTDLLDVAATAQGRTTQRLRQIAAKALEALLLEMNSAGLSGMQVNSGFRTYEYQAMLFDTYTQNELRANPNLTKEAAEKLVLTYSTRPGTSEHQTGLAVDMATDASFSTDFSGSEHYAWLQENAWKFGFILRFPEDKVPVTGIQFEPWHWRFVGRYHAKKIHDAGVCLEEYIAGMTTEEAAAQ